MPERVLPPIENNVLTSDTTHRLNQIPSLLRYRPPGSRRACVAYKPTPCTSRPPPPRVLRAHARTMAARRRYTFAFNNGSGSGSARTLVTPGNGACAPLGAIFPKLSKRDRPLTGFPAAGESATARCAGVARLPAARGRGRDFKRSAGRLRQPFSLH